MLRSQQTSAPAITSLKRVNEEDPIPLQVDLSNQYNFDSNLFWPLPDPSQNSTQDSLKAPAFSLHLDSRPKVVSQLLLDNLQARTSVLESGLSTPDAILSTSSVPASTTSTNSLHSNIFPPSNSAGDISPAMSAGSNYHFETPSLHQVSALNAPFATSSPAVASTATGEPYSTKASPSQYEESWNQSNLHDRKLPLESPGEYPHKNVASTGAHQTHQAQYHDHDYHGHNAYTAPSHYFQQHRASISGPLLDSAAYPERHETSSAAQPAPPRVHGLAAWENASGSARPHTADGMFGNFGVVGPAATSHDSSAEGSGFGNSAGSSSRPYTPSAHAAGFDPYSQHRRMSMPDPSFGGKVFSYMTPGEDGTTASSSSHSLGSHNYSGHYFGGSYGAASKKRPRRRYDEIERLYACSWPGCPKSYGTLNHLNAHVAMQKHGPKRSPSEFKDMRKAWRKQKKEEEQRKQARNASNSSMNEPSLHRQSFSGGSYGADVSSGPGELMGAPPSGSASALPLGGNAMSDGFGSAGGSTQLPAPLAHLGRYTMSSVSAAAPNANQPYYFHGSSGDSNLHSSTSSHAPQQHQDHSHPVNATPMQYAGDSRVPPYYQNLGAYLSAHRGSI